MFVQPKLLFSLYSPMTSSLQTFEPYFAPWEAEIVVVSASVYVTKTSVFFLTYLAVGAGIKRDRNHIT